MSPANPETTAALSLLNASAVRERAHRMLAIGLEDGLAELPHRPRSHGQHRRARAGDDPQGLSLARHSLSFALAALRRERGQSLGRYRRPGQMARSRGPRPGRIRSGHRQRPPRCRRRPVVALPRCQRPDRRSAVRKDWGWRASRCSQAAHSRPIHFSRCGSMPARSPISASPTSSAACRFRTPIRWSGSTVALTCCAAWAGWWRRNRRYSAASTRRGPAACSIGLRCRPTTGGSLPRRFCRNCCNSSDRSGRRD